MNNLLLIGGGGHCRAVIDVLEACQQSIAGIIHGPDCELKSVLGYAALGRDADLPFFFSKDMHAFITLGQIRSPLIRKKLFYTIKDIGFKVPRFISPLAYFSQHANLGKGSIVMHHALVNSAAHIGENCIINTKALVEHDCIIESHCHIAVGAKVCGEVHIGEGTFVGSGATIMQGISIGKNCVVGMGAIVKKNLPDESIYV